MSDVKSDSVNDVGPVAYLYGGTPSRKDSSLLDNPDRLSLAFGPLPDSGARETFDTGSVRDVREGKGRYDLITPIGLARLARHYEAGAKKYGERNWEKGQPVSRYLDSAIRHLYSYLAGNRDEDHLAAAAWNTLAAIHTETQSAEGNLPANLNDVDVPIDWKARAVADFRKRMEYE